MEHEGDSDTNHNWCTRCGDQRIAKETRRYGNKRTSRENPNYSIIKINQNSEKSLGDLRKLAVTQTHACVKNSQRSKTIKIYNQLL